MTEPGAWRLEGLDTFSGDTYAFPGSYPSLSAAEAAAGALLAELEASQPPAQSGGQSVRGIQDRVFIITPDGQRIRITG